MSRNAVETVMGGVVIAVAVGFLAFAYKSAGIGGGGAGSYEIKAKFDNIGGISAGSDVRVGGVKIGTVSGSGLDPDTYRAEITMSLMPEVHMPVDSTASIASDGLLGGKYVALVPGGEDAMLKAGDEIKFTQSSVNIEELIGKFMFSGGGVEGGKGSSAKSAEEPASAPAPVAPPSELPPAEAPKESDKL